MSEIDLWSNIEPSTLLSTFIGKINNKKLLKPNDLDLFILFTKNLLSDELTNETVDWLIRVVKDFLLPFFFRDNVNQDGSYDIILDIVRTVCSVKSVWMFVLEQLSRKMDEHFISLKNDKSTESHLLDTTMRLLQVCFDCLKKNQFSIIEISLKERFVQIVAELIQLEMVSDAHFLVANHILGHVLDVQTDSHKQVILSLIQKLHEQEDFKRLLLLLAFQAAPLAQSDFIEKEIFWKILQDGLVCVDPLARKRSLYIIKCVLEVVSNKLSFHSDAPSENGPVMMWSGKNSEDLWKIWKIFVLLCETFEEKQMHVINPVLPLLNDILQAINEKNLHYSWLLVLLTRAIQHESRLLNTWAIHFCLHLDLSSFAMLSQTDWTFVFDTLFESFKSIYLYNKDKENSIGTAPSILALMGDFFTSCFAVMEPKKHGAFWNKILVKLSSKTFNEASIFFITKSLSKQRISTTLQNEDILMLKDFLVTKFPVYKIEYQKVIFQHLSEFYCNNMSLHVINVEHVISLLSHAYDSGIMTLGGNCWTFWRDLLLKIDFVDMYKDKLKSYLKDSSGYCKDVIILLQLLLDHGNRENVGNFFHDVTIIITKLSSNPYMSSETILNCIEFVYMTLKMMLQSPSKYSTLFGYVVEYAAPVLEYLYTLVNCGATSETDLLQIVEKCFLVVNCFIELANCSSQPEDSLILLRRSLSDRLSNLHGEVLKKLNAILHKQTDIDSQRHGLIALRFLRTSLSWRKENATDEVSQLCKELCLKFMRKELAALQKNDKHTTTLNCDAFIVNCWQSMALVMSKTPLDLHEDGKRELLEAFQSDLTIVSSRQLPEVVSFARYFVDIFKEDNEQIVALVDILWRLLRNQLHSDQTFRQIYKKCIEVFFHRDILASHCEQVIEKVVNSWKDVLEMGETKPLVTNIAVDCFLITLGEMLSSGSSQVLNYVDVFAQVAVFGPLRQKRERPYNDLCSFIFQNTDYYDDVVNLKSFRSLDQRVRIAVVNFILNLPETKVATLFCIRLVQTLVRLEQNMAQKCYYPNSEHHRKKLRAWQMILVLFPKLPQETDCADLLREISLSCKSDNQPSIRYLAEWSIILVLLRDSSLTCKLWEELESSTEKKILSVTFVLSIAIQLSKILGDNDFVTFAESAIPKILPWSHAHHMTSRIHSHIALENIWKRVRRSENNALKEKFAFLDFSFSLTNHNTAGVKHKELLMKSYFYSNFHALDDYNLEFIFKTFPKHHGVVYDEWLESKHFTIVEDQTSIPVLRRTTSDCGGGGGSGFESVVVVDNELVKDDSEVASYTDIQKKIMPWNLAPSDDLVLQSELSRKKDLGQSELILCAVLVDKIPNLGGLCRTAEIFGTRRLLIGSNRYVNDPNFKSLSVTSEKWIEIEQVLPIKLAGYLCDMKASGYTIVGVEQTANSKMIGQFEFSRKTILVLGNEKTGIPVDLIQLLDECVEIPQFGIIRSLNVHISGAIMMWEYCKQHSM